MSNKSRYWLRGRKISQEITNFMRLKETTNITTARKKAHCLYQSNCSFFQHFWDHIIFDHLFRWQRFYTFIFYGKSTKVIQGFFCLCWLKLFLVFDSLETFFFFLASRTHCYRPYISCGVIRVWEISTKFLSQVSYVIQNNFAYASPGSLFHALSLHHLCGFGDWYQRTDPSACSSHESSSHYRPGDKGIPEASSTRAQTAVINYTEKWLQSPWTYPTK